MERLNLEKLEARVQKEKERARKRAKESYQLARSLGFSSYEAMALQNRSESTIRRLAKERNTHTKSREGDC